MSRSLRARVRLQPEGHRATTPRPGQEVYPAPGCAYPKPEQAPQNRDTGTGAHLVLPVMVRLDPTMTGRIALETQNYAVIPASSRDHEGARSRCRIRKEWQAIPAQGCYDGGACRDRAQGRAGRRENRFAAEEAESRSPHAFRGCQGLQSNVIARHPTCGLYRAEAYSVHPVADPGSALIRRTGPQRHS